jgi:hypothetical protein
LGWEADNLGAQPLSRHQISLGELLRIRQPNAAVFWAFARFVIGIALWPANADLYKELLQIGSISS